VREIGVPGHEEYGIGELVHGASPQVVIDEAAARMVGADQAYIDGQVGQQLEEIERRRAAYRTGPPIPLAGRTVIVVDDGIAFKAARCAPP
jgi:putative phosphoribosyl transferase